MSAPDRAPEPMGGAGPGLPDRADRSLAVRRARDIWTMRAGARTVGDLAYWAYGAVMVTAVIVVPGLVVLLPAIARPDLIGPLLTDSGLRLLASLVLLGFAGAVAAGAQRGPALTSPFFATTLGACGLPRGRVLRGPYLLAAAIAAGLGALFGGLLGAAAATAGLVPVAGGIALGLAGIGVALLGTVCWLAGEVVAARGRRILMAALAVAAGLVWFPGGAAAIRAVALAPLGAALVLAAAGALAMLGLRWLDRIRGDVLLAQSLAWEGARTSAATGDLSTSAGALRALPSSGRSLPAVLIVRGPRWWRLAVLYTVRDAIAPLRTPERAAIAGLALVGGGAAIAWCVGALLLLRPLSLPLPVALPAWPALSADPGFETGLGASPVLAGIVGIAGALAVWGATSALADGLRHGLATAGSPALFGQDPTRATLLHLIAPLALATALVVLGAAGGAAAVIAATPGGLASGAGVLMPSLLAAAALAALLVVARLRDAAKGPMPIEVLTPIPTPMGDLSALRVLGWQLDSLRLVVVLAVAVVGGALLGPMGLLGAAVLMVLWAGGGAWSRVRALAEDTSR